MIKLRKVKVIGPNIEAFYEDEMEFKSKLWVNLKLNFLKVMSPKSS